MAKALPTTNSIGISRAIEIWDIIGVKDYNFGSMPFDEKALSIKTWEGCDNVTYDSNKGKYNRLNNAVMEALQIANNNKPVVMRIFNGKISKICKVTKADARNSVNKKLNMASGFLTNSVKWNDKLNLKLDVYEKTITKTMIDLQSAGYTSEEAKEMLIQAVDARRKIEYTLGKPTDQVRKELAKEILGTLDSSPALIACDNKMKNKLNRTDKYTEDANKRRKRKK